MPKQRPVAAIVPVFLLFIFFLLDKCACLHEQPMLAFLINKCGADVSELPQLVRLNHLLLEEDEENGAAATVQPSSQGTTTATTTTTTTAASAATSAAEMSTVAPKDASMLGFLLDKCASKEERAQCPVLQQMRGWLLQDAAAAPPENAANAQQPNALASVAHKAGLEAAATAASAAEKLVHEEDICCHENKTAAQGTASIRPPPQPPTVATSTTPVHAAGEGSQKLSSMLPVTDIPVPILPGAGDWKGSITVYAAAPPLPTSSQPTANAPKPERVDARHTANGRAGHEAATPSSTATTCVENNAVNKAAVTLPQGTTPNQQSSEKRALADVTAANDIVTANPAATSAEPSRLQHTTLPSYAGRMPCPASEALAVRNSAAVRLLSGVGSRPSSGMPPASRPMSGFAKRLMADLYDRVSTPHTVSGGPAAVAQSQAPTLTHAIGSGVRAAREHQQQLQHQKQWQQRSSSHEETGEEPWHNTAASHALHLTPALPAGRRTSGFEFRQRRSSLSNPAVARASRDPTVVLPGVGPAGRTPRRPLSAVHGQPAAPTPGSADLTGLVVVGARIRLPSAQPTRPRYAS